MPQTDRQPSYATHVLYFIFSNSHFSVLRLRVFRTGSCATAAACSLFVTHPSYTRQDNHMPCHSWRCCQRVLLLASCIFPLAGSFCPYTPNAGSSRVSSRQWAAASNVQGRHPISGHDHVTLRRRRAIVTGGHWRETKETLVRQRPLSVMQQGWGEGDDLRPINGEVMLN